jgi:hypothetical protein
MKVMTSYNKLLLSAKVTWHYWHFLDNSRLTTTVTKTDVSTIVMAVIVISGKTAVEN